MKSHETQINGFSTPSYFSSLTAGLWLTQDLRNEWSMESYPLRLIEEGECEQPLNLYTWANLNKSKRYWE